MIDAAEKLLDEFESLPEEARSEVIAELVRRVALYPHGVPEEVDLVAAADTLFLALDLRERSDDAHAAR